MPTKFRILAPILGLSLLLLPGCAELDPALVGSVLGGESSSGELDESTVASGLREALRIGAAMKTPSPAVHAT